MHITEIIEKKKNKEALTKEEIAFWIDGVCDKSIADYQTSALLMAIVLNGMNSKETTDLTESMLHSGDIIDLSKLEGLNVDKHSTGGVGDKTTLILSPIVAASGAKVAKMSGRGLGHTGGTLDKLESIPGYNIEISGDAFINQVNDINVAVVGQTGNLVYADKILYGLRDVTGTVNSIPLIASSVMSKKLAGGADCILLDVKYGEGAFMKTIEDAKKLAQTMITIGNNLGKKVNAMITNMNTPLGHNIGNALEVHEAILTLKNEGPEDLEQLCLEAAGQMLYQAQLVSSYEEGLALATENLRNGSAYKKFLEWIEAQGGDISVFDDLDAFINAKYVIEVKSDAQGYLTQIHALNLGLASLHLGAGRKTVDDIIDYKAGISIQKDIGDMVQKGDVLALLYSDSPIGEESIAEVRDCFEIKDKPQAKPNLIADVL